MAQITKYGSNAVVLAGLMAKLERERIARFPDRTEAQRHAHAVGYGRIGRSRQLGTNPAATTPGNALAEGLDIAGRSRV